MNKEEFWKIVEKINWSHTYWRRQGVEICKDRYMKLCHTQQMRNEFGEILGELFEDLQTRIESYYEEITNGQYSYLMPDKFSPNGYIGDDTLNDGLHHIIGKGKKTYDSVMKNPDTFWKNFGDVYHMMRTESFWYVTFNKEY